MIKVIGLGSNDGEMSLKGAGVIDSSEVVVVKTALTDTYKFFTEENIEHTTCDKFYEEAKDFEELNELIVNYLLSFGDKKVCYCVNGNGVDDRSVSALKKVADIEIIPGVSCETRALKFYPNTSYLSFSAYDINEDNCFEYDKKYPLIVKDIDNIFIAGGVKEVLSRLLGDDADIIFFNDGNEKIIKVYELDRFDNYNYNTAILAPPLDLENMKEYNFIDLMRIMKRLRGVNGCDWDKAQTHSSIRANVIEEAYELAEAINNEDIDNIIEEAGDIILQGVFHAVIGDDEGEFEAKEVLTSLCRKLITRHTHIFGNVVANSPEEALRAWENAKAVEKNHKSGYAKMLGIAESLPALMKAKKIQRIARKSGLDFSCIDEIIEKIKEELNECINADRSNIEEECGDLLFAVVNFLRFLDIDGEIALGRANEKFAKRYSYIEKVCGQNNKKMDELSAEELDKLWQEAKKI